MLAGVLYSGGARAAAERQYRDLLVSRPNSAQIQVQLAEAMLHQARYAEAADQAAGVGQDDAFAALAGRIELWGRIAGGDLDGARQARDRALRAGVTNSQLAVFDAWLELARGTETTPTQATPTEPTRTLPVAATPLLGVILETSLRAHDFETFEQLVGLLHRSALAPREQRELLATMYLEHGFLASAAQEWMAVCESAPDGRAFLGLARVAVGSGQLEDAAVFAAEALKHDSANAAARQILARCSAPEIAPMAVAS
jgi:hypothetical protein